MSSQAPALFSQPETPNQISALAASDSAKSVQEVQAALIIAKRFPRNEIEAIDRIKNACTRPKLAAAALYQYARGGSNIEGPSIRLAEAIAQQWGNLDFGFRELGRSRGQDGINFSEVECYAWDMQTNTRRSVKFVVRHWRDKKNGGGYALTDERDLYELVANQAARRVRACILTVIPGDVVEEAVEQSNATLAADADVSPSAQAKIVKAFSDYGVTKEQIEAKIQRRMDAIAPAQVVQLRKIMNSLKDGMSQPAEWFEAAKTDTPAPKLPKTKTAAQSASVTQRILDRLKDHPGLTNDDVHMWANGHDITDPEQILERWDEFLADQRGE